MLLETLVHSSGPCPVLIRSGGVAHSRQQAGEDVFRVRLERRTASGSGELLDNGGGIGARIHLAERHSGRVDLLLAGAEARERLLGFRERGEAVMAGRTVELLGMLGGAGQAFAALQF